MKKKNLKSLKLNKKSISNLQSDATIAIKGGGPTNGKKCDPTLPQSDPCVTVETCFCTVDAGCLLTIEVDFNGNHIC